MADATVIGDALVRFAGDDTKLGQSLKKAEKDSKGVFDKIAGNSKKIGIAMTAVGAGIIGTLTVMTKKWADAGDQVQKMSLRTGISTETLSEFKHAAELSGTSLDGLEKGVKKMQQSIFEAGQGTSTYVDALGFLGLTYEDLANLSPEEQFIKLTAAVAGVEDPTSRAAIAAEIFGRAGTQLLPMLAGGAEGLAAMRQEAHELGIVFDQEAANKAAAFNDTMQRLGESFKGMGMAIAPVIADLVEKFVPIITDIIVSTANWMKENDKLVGIIVMVVGGIGVFLTVVGPLLIILPGLVTAFGALSAILPLVGAAFTAALGPIGLIILAIAAVIAVGVLVVKNWDWIKEQAAVIWDKIAIGLEEAWDIIVSIFEGGIDFVKGVFNAWLGWQKMTWGLVFSVFEKAGDILSGVWDIITKDFGAAVGFIKHIFGGFLDAIDAGLTWFGDAFQGAFNFVAGIVQGIAELVRQAIDLISSIPGAGAVAGALGFDGRGEGLQVGGMIGGKGFAAVQVHRDEQVLLPAGAEVIPRQHSDAVMSAMEGGRGGGGGGPITLTVAPNAVNVSVSGFSGDPTRLAQEINRTVGAVISEELRAQGVMT